MEQSIVVAVIGLIGTVVASVLGVYVSHWLTNRPHGATGVTEAAGDDTKGGVSGDPPSPGRPLDWPGNEKQGVWLVRLKEGYSSRLRFPVPARSYVHFSWDWSRNGASYLRQYVEPGRPASYRGPLDAAEVFRNIDGEPIVYRRNERKAVEDSAWWHEEIRKLNDGTRDREHGS